jgi:hypothetical protein
MRVADKRPSVAALVAAVLAGLTVAFLVYTEPTSERFWFAVATTAAIGCGLALVSRRLLFSSILTFALVALILLVSLWKRATMNMSLHSYDLFFYLNRQTLEFLWGDYRGYVAGVGVALIAAIFAAILAWRLEPPRLRRSVTLWVLIAVVGLTAILEPRAKAQSGAFRMFTEENSYVSAFLLSWGETWSTLARGQLIEAAARTTLPNFRRGDTCTPTAKPPHIVLIHQESLVPPSLFPNLQYDHSLDPFFLSDDKQLHRLRVETYGGGSWVTEFALLSGMSTKAFGDMQMFVQVLMQDRLRDSLPQSLKACGYRTLMLFPMDSTFLSLDRFYRSIGFHEILDRKAQGAAGVRERDRFYFENMINAMDRHLRSSDKPLFAYVQTMASHGPYDTPYMPDVDVPGGGPGTSPEMNEFLRRTAMAKRDGDFLVAEIKRRFPNERVLIVRYGDHQPSATYDLIDRVWGDDNPVVGEGGKPGPYITYYSMLAQNLTVPPLPVFDPLDVAYLGTVIMDAAGLPLSGSQLERKRLMAACNGRYFGCVPQSDIMAFHRRLINSGLVKVQ